MSILNRPSGGLYARGSATKLNVAVMRLIDVAMRGLANAFLMCVSTVRLAVRLSLSTA